MVTKKLFLSIALIVVALSANAETVEIGGIYYNLTAKMGIAEVVNNPNKYKGNITIPESVSYEGKAYKVTRIGYEAFKECSGLSSVVLPNSIEVIEDFAFRGCRNLTSFTFPNSLKKISGFAFYGCTRIKSIDIPNSVESIGTAAFSNCWAITTVILGENVKNIDRTAFSGCRDLISINIPQKVNSISENLFMGCSKLQSIELPNSILLIDNYAFGRCVSLSSITIPNSVKTIDFHAFDGCNKLTKVVIGKNVNTIDKYAFANCSDLTDVYCYAEKLNIGISTFENSYIEYATLHVPSESLDFYQNSYNWKMFKDIVPINDSDPKPTAITTITVDDDNDIKYYTIDGKSIIKPQKGINILKYSDGTIKKVVIR